VRAKLHYPIVLRHSRLQTLGCRSRSGSAPVHKLRQAVGVFVVLLGMTLTVNACTGSTVPPGSSTFTSCSQPDYVTTWAVPAVVRANGKAVAKVTAANYNDCQPVPGAKIQFQLHGVRNLVCQQRRDRLERVGRHEVPGQLEGRDVRNLWHVGWDAVRAFLVRVRVRYGSHQTASTLSTAATLRVTRERGRCQARRATWGASGSGAVALAAIARKR